VEVVLAVAAVALAVATRAVAARAPVVALAQEPAPLQPETPWR
jgi:hypothetical protein